MKLQLFQKLKKVQKASSFFLVNSFGAYNHGYNILELCIILEKFRFTRSKAVVDI